MSKISELYHLIAYSRDKNLVVSRIRSLTSKQLNERLPDYPNILEYTAYLLYCQKILIEEREELYESLDRYFEYLEVLCQSGAKRAQTDYGFELWGDLSTGNPIAMKEKVKNKTLKNFYFYYKKGAPEKLDKFVREENDQRLVNILNNKEKKSIENEQWFVFSSKHYLTNATMNVTDIFQRVSKKKNLSCAFLIRNKDPELLKEVSALFRCSSKIFNAFIFQHTLKKEDRGLLNLMIKAIFFRADEVEEIFENLHQGLDSELAKILIDETIFEPLLSLGVAAHSILQASQRFFWNLKDDDISCYISPLTLLFSRCEVEQLKKPTLIDSNCDIQFWKKVSLEIKQPQKDPFGLYQKIKAIVEDLGFSFNQIDVLKDILGSITWDSEKQENASHSIDKAVNSGVSQEVNRNWLFIVFLDIFIQHRFSFSQVETAEELCKISLFLKERTRLEHSSELGDKKQKIIDTYASCLNSILDLMDTASADLIMSFIRTYFEYGLEGDYLINSEGIAIFFSEDFATFVEIFFRGRPIEEVIEPFVCTEFNESQDFFSSYVEEHPALALLISRRGQLNTIKKLLSSCDVAVKSKSGNTIYHILAQRYCNNYEVLKEIFPLLNKKLDINEIGSSGTPWENFLYSYFIGDFFRLSKRSINSQVFINVMELFSKSGANLETRKINGMPLFISLLMDFDASNHYSIVKKLADYGYQFTLDEKGVELFFCSFSSWGNSFDEKTTTFLYENIQSKDLRLIMYFATAFSRFDLFERFKKVVLQVPKDAEKDKLMHVLTEVTNF